MKNIFLAIITLFFLFGCATIEPNTKSTSSTRPTYEQILKENYKGRKARLLITHFVDKSDSGKETSKIGEGMAEMLRNALLPTNRYIIQVRKSFEDISKGQDLGNSGSVKKEFDLLVEGEIKDFKPGIPGAGGESGGASYITIVITVINPMTKHILATEKVKAKATEFGGPTAKVGGTLPEIFRIFSKTLMEKAIRMTVEESATLIVAKTPVECYRVVPVVTQKETPKPPPVSPKVTPPPPPPTLRTAQVVWDSVNLRQGPGTKYKVVGNAKKGTPLKIIEVDGDWLRIRLEDGTTAWLNKQATSETSKAPPPKASTSTTPAPM